MSKIDEISIVFPCDKDRVPLLLNTLSRYLKLGVPDKVELILVSRTFTDFVIPGWDTKVVSYENEGKFFCPSLAYNLGFAASRYKNVIIGHPEVMPFSNVLAQFFGSERGNYVCKVYDLDVDGRPRGVLFSSEARPEWIGLYFLALYKREDVEAINGWDMRFMEGYANEDIDFGQRLWNAGFTQTIRDDIVGGHQWHSRACYEDSKKEWQINRNYFDENKAKCIGCVEKGLREC